MKTFTNYAEKKAKQFLNLLQGYTKGIRMTAILVLLLMGVTKVWAYDQSAVDLYFDNSTAKWTNCYVYIGHSSYTSCYAMTRVSGTQYLWKLASNFNGGSKWGGASGWVVSSEKWWDSKDQEDVYKFVYHGNNKVTDIRTSAWNATTIYKADGTQSVTHYSQACTVYKWATSTKSDYTVTINSPTGGTLTVKDYDNTTVTSGTKKVKLTVLKFSASASTGYTFGGVQINNGSSTTTIAAADIASKTYTLTSNVTITPIWTANQYTINYKDQGGGAFSGTHESGYPTTHTYGTATTLKTASKTGYTFEGWYKESACTNKVTTLGATAYTANITLYAKWTAIAETKYDVTISANANGSVNPSGTQKVGATGINATATANTGYKFKQWSYTAGAKANPLNTETTLITATGDGTVTASFEEILYDITITSNNAAYGDVNPKSAKAGITTTVEIEATPVDGYEFVKWTAPNSITLSSTTNANATITKATAKGIVSATFQEKTHPVLISYKSGNTHLQSATTQEVGEVTKTSFTAPAITGYTFTGWTLGTGITNHSANTTTNPISITTNSTGSGYTLTANYEKAKYTFTFGVQGMGGSVSATVGGNKITSPATLEHGTVVALTASAKDGYKFSKWVDGSGTQLSTDATYPHTLNAAATIKAVFVETNVLYLKPGDWTSDNAWFAAYFFNGDKNEWVRMRIADPCNIIYKVAIPAGDWTNVIFVRMNKDVQDPSFDGKWNQTGDLTIPTNGNNMFTPNLNNGWNDMTSSWGVYNSDYVPVTYNVTVPEGTPGCYIVGDWNWNEFIEMTKVDDTHYTITLDIACDSHKYKYCYGPSWGCQEVKSTAKPTQGIDDRTYSPNDNVVAWIKYCIVGFNGNWDWNTGYEFDINGHLYQHLASVKTHNFKIRSSIDEYYTTDSRDNNKHIFTRDHNQEYLPTKQGDYHDSQLQVDVAGYYDFNFNPVNKFLTITFPADGYQIEVTMGETKYKSNTVKNAEDTISFFAPGESDGGSVQLYHNGFLKSTIDASTFKTSGVYTAKLNANKNGITDVALYEGNYYIRTDGANGGWNDFKTNDDNKMTYFVPREREKYSYYWVAALPRVDRNADNGVVNVKACVANDYNNNLANMLEADKFTDVYGSVVIKDPSDQKREKINVRFGYNPKTNHFERAMLTGSGNMPNFLNITDPEGCVFKDKNGTTALTEANSDSKFTDVSNWVYETNVWVRPDKTNGATVCLTSTAYNDKINSLFGFEADGITPKQDTIIGQNSGETREMRIVYDFKTNRMIMAWIPGDITISNEEALHADVLFIRHENDDVPQLKITSNGKIKDIQSQFFALELENDANNGGNQEHHYWISLPFDCVVGSISGVPGYMEIWGIQRYNGKKRAEKGWFKEDYTFWEWLTPNDTLKAGEGYVLSFDKKAATWNTYDVHEKDENGNTISTTQKSLLRLYFPSTKEGYLFQENTQLRTDYPNQPCNIERENRKQQDSNWKIIATTSYYNAQVASGEDYSNDSEHYLSEFPNFRYTYTYDNSNMNNRTWSYTPEHGGQGAEYKSFHSYMVQYAGTITWKALNESVMPVGLAARRNSNAKATNITTRLELANAEGIKQDQTFVALDEKGTTTFDQNLDLNKVFNSGKANVYTLSEGIPFAGNTLPMGEALVPVGVQIAAEGEYTFRMPDGTGGMVVELIDYELETTTNLLLFDYTVTLPKGTNEGRFALHIQPSKSGVTTGIEGAYPQPLPEGKGTKFLIDGKLIIRTAEGEVFDAQGHRL